MDCSAPYHARKGVARRRLRRINSRRLRNQRKQALIPAGRLMCRFGWGGWCFHCADLHACAVTDRGLDRSGICGRYDRRFRSHNHGSRQSSLGVTGRLLDTDRALVVETGMAMIRSLIQGTPSIGIVVLFAIPYMGTPDFYLSYLYNIFFWIALSTSWGILSGYTGYWSFGHAAFFGTGVYTAATLAGKLETPFVLTIPAAAALAALLSAAIGVIVFRIKSLRAEFFALLTLSVAFVISSIVSNTAIDGGSGVFLGNIVLPRLGTSDPGTIYLLGLVIAIASLVISRAVLHSRVGIGLLAIHDDEDVAEVKGVPTFRYKLIVFAISSAIAGATGAVNAAFVSYVTVG